MSNPGSAARRILALTSLPASALQLWTACGKKAPPDDPKVVRGQVLFFANCISCHNGNPAFDGTLGPAIKGSALELVQARVLRGEYPPGYTPKRTTRIMQKLPLTEANVDDIHAFLNAQ